MSKVKIEGNASGTGTLTISAPNTDTDRSITLPDGAGEVLVTDGTITIDDTNDRVGIGTSSPSQPLSVYGTDGSNNTALFTRSGGTTMYAYIDTGSNAGFFTGSNASGSGFYANSSDNSVRVMTASSERMRINSSGLLCINITSPTTGGLNNAYITVDLSNQLGHGLNINSLAENSSAIGIRKHNTSGTSYPLYIVNSSNSNVGSISMTNSGVAFNTSSDYRLKENVVDMTGAIDRVKALQPKRFNFIADEDDTTVDGFLAHEVSDIIPEAISGEKDATKEEEYEVTPAVLDDDGNVVTEAVMGTRTVPDYQGIDQSKLVPLLTGALQEAITKIEALETRIETLENA